MSGTDLVKLADRPGPGRRPRRTAPALAVAIVVIGLLAACTSASTPSPPAASRSANATAVPLTPGSTTVLLSQLDGSTVPTAFTLVDDTRGLSDARFYLTTGSTQYLSEARSAPFQAAITVPAGKNTIEVRQVVDGDKSKVRAHFTAEPANSASSGSAAGGPTTPTTPLTTPPNVAFATPAATTTVSTPAELAEALAKARPGTVIRLADGQYENNKGHRWNLAASGTAAKPITLAGGRGAIIESDSTKGDYGLWITGSYWHVTGITVRTATKGIVLDGSQHSIIDNVDVHDIGQEGVHFRTCSSDDILQNSSIHDTGIEKPQFGEGVYVGSAQSNWGDHHCGTSRDSSERTVIRGNTFTHIAAEGADLKEGTDSGLLIDNTFSDTGYSGQNSADSAVDVKGDGWTVAGNTVTDPQGADTDAFQTHTLYPGYGTGNTFTGNVVTGNWPGFGFALFPQAANVVRCDNRAPGAVKGLVGAEGKSITCSG